MAVGRSLLFFAVGAVASLAVSSLMREGGGYDVPFVHRLGELQRLGAKSFESREAWLQRRLGALEQAIGRRRPDLWARKTEEQVRALGEANAYGAGAQLRDVRCVTDLCRARFDIDPTDSEARSVDDLLPRQEPFLTRRFQHCPGGAERLECSVYFVRRGAQMPTRPS